MVDHLLSGGNKSKKKMKNIITEKKKLATKNVHAEKRGKCKKK
jgi:hypothetical protein